MSEVEQKSKIRTTLIKHKKVLGDIKKDNSNSTPVEVGAKKRIRFKKQLPQTTSSEVKLEPVVPSQSVSPIKSHQVETQSSATTSRTPKQSTKSDSTNRRGSVERKPYDRDKKTREPQDRRDRGFHPKSSSSPLDRRGVPIQKPIPRVPKATTNDEKKRMPNQAGLEQDNSQSKRIFKATRKKQHFVNKKKQFEEKEKQLNIRGKKQVNIAPANPIPKSISIMESVSVVDLAKKMNLKASELLSKLMEMGSMGNLNSIIDYETAQLLANEYECEVKVVSLYEQTLIDTPEDEEVDQIIRPPIITIMGHVDHGKTTLLDVIRNSDMAENEQGSITQHIGAYLVETNHGKITFLDTPGHEAFSLMRSRGANITDIIVLVVAADDGLMPQTLEAIALSKKENVPVIVALNKIDSSSANIDRVLQQLTEHELMPEEWGGQTPVCKISALKGEGIDELLEHIILQVELMDIKSNIKVPAQGVVLETRMEPGKGIVLTVLIKKGILHAGDSFISGIYSGKVRSLYNDRGITIENASPGIPVEIIGIDKMPSAGEPFQVTENERIARQTSMKRQELARHQAGENVHKVTADTLYASIEKESINTLNVIIKGDVHGSVEAIKESLEQLSTDEIRVKVIHASAGTINVADINRASTSNALVIGFHVRPTQQVIKLANQEKVTIQRYTVIFDVIESVKKQLSGMLSPIYEEQKVGEAMVRSIFSIPQVGVIAGSYVQSGKIEKDSIIKIMRQGKEIHSGNVASLKRFENDVSKVDKGHECGIAIENTSDIQEDDVLQIFKKVVVARTL